MVHEQDGTLRTKKKMPFPFWLDVHEAYTCLQNEWMEPYVIRERDVQKETVIHVRDVTNAEGLQP
jgi:hypothetical protein